MIEKMSKERQGEIALIILTKELVKRGIPGEGFRRDIGNASKDLDISKDELLSFYTELLPEVVGGVLGVKDVSVIIGDHSFSG